MSTDSSATPPSLTPPSETNLPALLRTLQATWPNFSEEQRVRAAQIISRLKWSRENEGIRWFKPHGGQEDFIASLDAETLLSVTGAGNGWGKSEVLAALLAAAMWPDMAPACLKVPLFQEWSYPKRARVYSTPAELAEIGSLQTAIAKLFPKGRYSVSKGLYNYPSVFTTDTGWVLDMFSYERPAKEAAGPNIGLQVLNEPPPEDLYKEAVARSRAGGIIIGGMTSLKDEVWVVDGLLSKHDGKTIKVRYGNSCENCIEHGKNGNLQHSRIMQILDQFDPDEREARYTGKPLSHSGRIFKTFDRSVHVAKGPIQPPTGGVSFFQSVDPAGGKPFAILWAFADIAGNVTVFDEWPNYKFFGAKDPCLTVTDYKAMFAQKESFRVETRIMDKRYGNTSHKPGAPTLKEDFSAIGLDFVDSYSVGANEQEVQTGILKVGEYLKWDKEKPQDAANHPRLLISPTCTNLIASLERWTRNPDTLKPLDDHYKDFSDALRYLLMAEPKYEVALNWERGSAPYYGVGSQA